MEMIRGDDQTIPVFFKDANGTAIDITGATVYFTVKRVNNLNDVDDSNALIAKIVTSHTDAVGGETVIDIAGTDLAVVGLHRYDLQIKYVDGTRNSIASGYFDILQDVTKT